VNKSDLPNISRSRKSLASWTTALIAGAFAAAVVIIVTRSPGPGLDPDAASYLGAAQSLANGRGYRVPIADWASADSTSALSHFPPGYPTAIAVPVALGTTPAQGARFVNAAAAFIEVALAVWLVSHVAGALGGTALALALLVMQPFVEVHLSVLSEPLFLACMMGALAGMVKLAEQDDERNRLTWILATGLAAAGALLVRFAGLSVGAAVVLWILVQPGPRATRARRAAIALLPSLLLAGAWVVSVHLTSGVRAIRTLGAYGDFGDTLRMGFSTVVAWLVPLTPDETLFGRTWLALALLAALALVVVRGVRGAMSSTAARPISAAAILALSYVVVLVASRCFADPGIPFDNRLLAPLFLLVSILGALGISMWWGQARTPARFVCATVLLAWLGASFNATFDEVTSALDLGEDLAQPQWVASPLLAWARANAGSRPLYTNWPPVVLFHLHRASHALPATADVLEAFTDTVRVRNGVVLVFDQRNPDDIGADDVSRAPGLRRIARAGDGSVFVAAPRVPVRLTR
jgi:hypothetical protein